jgi:hypothetical protein
MRALASAAVSFGIAAAVGLARPAGAAPGDTTWVRTFDHDFYNWATPHEQTFEFPDTSVGYGRILLRYRIGCPEAPGDCDPWDRIGYLRVMHDTGEVDSLGEPVIEPYEIARIITPYDITGGTRPDSCTWILDVTDYETFLHDTVTLSNYIESWIGGIRGWIVTIDFAFIEGEKAWEPFRVINLWGRYYAVYGDPSRPIEDVLAPMDVEIDAAAARVKVRVITTGHGQGNTDNAAEFAPKEHTIVANTDTTSHILWRTDCNVNPCSPQGGTWAYSRAGWCPGDKVDPWDVDASFSVTPGEIATFDYDIQAYENFCRPDNPDCVSGVTCPDCNYNSTGHTEPHYAIQSQLVLYKAGTLSAGDPAAPAAEVSLDQNRPNPFNPATAITYFIPDGRAVRLVIFDAGGRIVREIRRSHRSGGKYTVLWDGRDDRGQAVASGAYFYSLEPGAKTQPKKMILVK